jgi:hypothetical protein
MEVRLADRQGLLTGRSLNYFQWWAMSYMIGVDARQRHDTIDAFVRRYTNVVHPDRYMQVYAKPIADMVDEDEGVPYGPESFDEMDKVLQAFDSKRVGVGRGNDEGWV